jgi:hypothetical protein
MGERTNAYRVLVGMSDVMTPLGRTRVGRRIILKWILKKFS